ncbi:MAG: hypothetical protein G01um101429_978 [Parcubacteria group bacterium Gr01-1014_29]|nr:MAG: hypothetical protein G01um101429_978 [Parcubacteria group bacterium Gr01-1014_29]
MTWRWGATLRLTPGQILKEFPDLEREDIKEALAFAAEDSSLLTKNPIHVDNLILQKCYTKSVWTKNRASTLFLL